jgi:hypothetical protein
VVPCFLRTPTLLLRLCSVIVQVGFHLGSEFRWLLIIKLRCGCNFVPKSYSLGFVAVGNNYAFAAVGFCIRTRGISFQLGTLRLGVAIAI